MKSFRTVFVTLLYIYLSLSAKEKFNIIGSKANQIQLFHGAFLQTDTDPREIYFFLAVITILFYLQVRKYIEKLEQRLWHSWTSGTAINNLNTTTLPNQKYNKKTELPLLLQPSNCAHNLVLTAAPPIPAVIAQISPSALEFSKFEFVYIHPFHRNNILKLFIESHQFLTVYSCSSEQFLSQRTRWFTYC